MRFAKHSDGTLVPYDNQLGVMPARRAVNPATNAAYTDAERAAALNPPPPVVETPFWQQWYVLLPVGLLGVYVLFGRKKSKSGDASATPSALPTLSGLFGFKKRRKRK